MVGGIANQSYSKGGERQKLGLEVHTTRLDILSDLLGPIGLEVLVCKPVPSRCDQLGHGIMPNVVVVERTDGERTHGM